VALPSRIVLVLLGQHDVLHLLLSVVHHGLLALRVVDRMLVEVLVGPVVHLDDVLHIDILLPLERLFLVLKCG